MGDRGQILIKDTGVYLYTHWLGHNLPKILAKALARHQRWTDEEYLTRIIFSEMIKKDVDGEVGYGIGVVKHGDVDNLIVVSVADQSIDDGRVKLSFENYVIQHLKGKRTEN